jgi:hypothetical protein
LTFRIDSWKEECRELPQNSLQIYDAKRGSLNELQHNNDFQH